MKRLFATTAAAGLALAMSTATGSAQSDAVVQYDLDPEGGVTAESFATGFDRAGYYDTWDLDNDGVLSRDEFSRGVYGYYDRDMDGYWNAEEFTTMSNDAIWSGFEKDENTEQN